MTAGTPTRSRGILLVAAALAALLPRAAAAQDDGDKQRAYIIAVPADESLAPETARVGAAARAALRQVDGVNWQEPDKLYLGYGDQALERLAEARDQLERGRTAYLNLELERAIELLSNAVAAFDEAAIAMEDPKDLADALMFLGASQVFQGDMRAARDTFERLHVQMPHVDPDPNTFPPDVVQRFERAAPRDSRRPSSSISVQSDPPGATAYIDFVPRGRTPVEETELLSGAHIVRVVRPGATPFVETIDVGRRGGEQVNAFLADNPQTQGLADAVQRIAAGDVDQTEAPEPVMDVAGILDLDKIGVIRVSEGADAEHVHLEIAMYEVASGRRLVRGEGPAPTELGGPMQQAVKELVSGGLEAAVRPTQATDSENILATDDEVVDEDEDDDDEPAGTPVWKEWWFWTAIGGAVVIAVAVGAGVAAGGGGGQSLGQDQSGQVIFEF